MAHRIQQVGIYPEIMVAIQARCQDVPHLNLTSTVNRILAAYLNVEYRERAPRPYYPKTDTLREPHLRLLEFLNTE